MRFHRHFLRSWAILICLAMLVSEPASARQDAGGRRAYVVDAGRASGQVIQMEQASFPASAVAPLPLTRFYFLYGAANHVTTDTNGVWFSNPSNELVRLDTTKTKATFYARQDDGGLTWALKRDQAGKIWYTTAGADPDDAVGKFDPMTQEFTEWSSAEFENLTGLDIDGATGMVWFSGGGANGGIYRLNPAMNQINIWSTAPYSNTYDLALAPGGNVVWATLDSEAPNGKAGLLRLEIIPGPQAQGELTVWDMTGISREPYFVIAESSDEIWFTDIDRNGVSKFVVSSGGGEGTLSEYLLPVQNMIPSDLLLDGDRIWFTAETSDNIGLYKINSGTPVTQVLSSTSTWTKTPDLNPEHPDSWSADPYEVTYTQINSNIPGNWSETFNLYDLPDNSRPLGIARSEGGAIWFAASTYIGRLPTQQVFLPLVLR